jgi:hypothetical protein
MSKKHYYDVQAIKQRIDLIINDKVANSGDWLDYGTVDCATEMHRRLTAEGVNCRVDTTKIIFTDVTRIIKNNKIKEL